MRPKKKWPFIVVGAVVVIGLLGGGLYIKHRRDKTAERQAAAKSAAEAQTDSAKKQAAENKSGTNPTANLPKNSSSITSDQVPTDSGLSVAINSFDQTNHMVNAAATVSGTSTVGTCVFLYTTSTDDKPVSQQVSSTSNGSSQTCNSSVSEVEFSRLGTWLLKVTFYSGNNKAEATKSVTIN